MKIGEYKIKRRYSIAQIIVDITSLAALAYLGLIIWACAADTEKLKDLNKTNADMSMFDWKPLLIWAVVGVVIFGVSFFLIFRKKKLPKNYTVNENNAAKYCNIIDTCICCVRLVLIISLWEICYLHMSAILMRNISFSPQLVIDALIIVCIIIFTRMRVRAVSDAERERAASEKKREIVEN